MSGLWERGWLTRRRAVAAAAVLIVLLCAVWLAWGRPSEGTAGATASPTLEALAVVSASHSPSETPTPTPSASPPGASLSPSPSPTTAPKATIRKTPTPSGLPDLQAAIFGVMSPPLCEADMDGYLKLINLGTVTVPAGQIHVLLTLTEGGDITFKTTKTVPVALGPGQQYEVSARFRFRDPCPVELQRTWSYAIDPANEIQELEDNNNTGSIGWSHA